MARQASIEPLLERAAKQTDSGMAPPLRASPPAHGIRRRVHLMHPLARAGIQFGLSESGLRPYFRNNLDASEREG